MEGDADYLEKIETVVEGDVLKIKNKDLYEKVEGPLTSINGGVKIKPLDAETLTKAIVSLDEILKEVEKLK